MVASIAVRDLERVDLHIVDIGDQLFRLVDDMVGLLERDIDDVVLGIVGNSDEGRPFALDLVAQIERRSASLPSSACDSAAQNASHSAFLIARAVMACLSIAEFKPETNLPRDCSKR